MVEVHFVTMTSMEMLHDAKAIVDKFLAEKKAPGYYIQIELRAIVEYRKPDEVKCQVKLYFKGKIFDIKAFSLKNIEDFEKFNKHLDFLRLEYGRKQKDASDSDS